MRHRSFPAFGLLARCISVFLMLCAGLSFVTPGGVAASPGGNGGRNGDYCVAGGKGYVGPVSGDETGGNTVYLNWHGTYIISLCPGATEPQEGDSIVEKLTYPDGTTESYKIVFSTQDLTANGAFCYWDLTIDPGRDGSGYHCPALSGDPTHLYEWIISSSGDSPFLEPAGSGGVQSRPNGRGIYS